MVRERLGAPVIAIAPIFSVQLPRLHPALHTETFCQRHVLVRSDASRLTDAPPFGWLQCNSTAEKSYSGFVSWWISSCVGNQAEDLLESSGCWSAENIWIYQCVWATLRNKSCVLYSQSRHVSAAIVIALSVLCAV